MGKAFQFPSNGKVETKFNDILAIIVCPRRCFNSLQTGKQIQRIGGIFTFKTVEVFQFPSNGKADTKANPLRHTTRLRQKGFNSLQTGKQIQRLHAGFVTDLGELCFNSLQTGKQIGMSRQPSAISHQQRGLLLIKNLLLLTAESRKPKAITQFPSNGKAYPKVVLSTVATIVTLGFNSLQTGKRNCVRTQLVDRVCGCSCKYTLNLGKCQILPISVLRK